MSFDFFNAELTENGALAEGCFLSGLGWWIFPQVFTTRIAVGDPDNPYFLDDVWCYHEPEQAYEAIRAWNGAGEPEGWHRHPRTGRRRPGGDKNMEYVNR